MRQLSDQAKLFVECIQRRWHTLKRVAELVVDYQREFLEKGVRYLRPLTRTEIASRLGLDEGTVSRAIANKYALLPNGRLMSMSDFFDSSLGIKDILRELIMALFRSSKNSAVLATWGICPQNRRLAPVQLLSPPQDHSGLPRELVQLEIQLSMRRKKERQRW